MRFVDVRNIIGKAFCDYLLSGERSFLEQIENLEVPEEFKDYWENRLNFYKRFLEDFSDKIPAKDIKTVVFLGRFLNNRGLYFEGHEIIEKYWLRYRGEYRQFLQALIQVAIANMHLEVGNRRGYNRMKELALKNLEPYGGTIFGIDTAKLKKELAMEGERFFKL